MLNLWYNNELHSVLHDEKALTTTEMSNKLAYLVVVYVIISLETNDSDYKFNQRACLASLLEKHPQQAGSAAIGFQVLYGSIYPNEEIDGYGAEFLQIALKDTEGLSYLLPSFQLDSFFNFLKKKIETLSLTSSFSAQKVTASINLVASLEDCGDGLKKLLQQFLTTALRSTACWHGLDREDVNIKAASIIRQYAKIGGDTNALLDSDCELYGHHLKIVAMGVNKKQ